MGGLHTVSDIDNLLAGVPLVLSSDIDDVGMGIFVSICPEKS